MYDASDFTHWQTTNSVSRDSMIALYLSLKKIIIKYYIDYKWFQQCLGKSVTAL